MIHASLFSGIGGFDLAAEWAGWTNAFNCEIDPFCRRVLKYHFPDAEQYEDIRTADFTIWRDRIDVLTGGFPCQPFSLAGKRKGTEDDRYLWPEMLRVIRTVRPRWVVGENVFGIVNWSEGMVFDKVCSDLEAAGYEVQPYIIPACGVGAPHRRDRCWFVAHRTDAGSESLSERQEQSDRCDAAADTSRFGCEQGRSTSNRVVQNSKVRTNIYVSVERLGSEQHVTDTQSERLSQWDTEPIREGTYPATQRHDIISGWQDFPTQSPVCGGDDGIPGRLDGITFSRWRCGSIKAYGNAIVPQVALQIFATINQMEGGGL